LKAVDDGIDREHRFPVLSERKKKRKKKKRPMTHFIYSFFSLASAIPHHKAVVTSTN